jgi:hypothetical protein
MYLHQLGACMDLIRTCTFILSLFCLLPLHIWPSWPSIRPLANSMSFQQLCKAPCQVVRPHNEGHDRLRDTLLGRLHGSRSSHPHIHGGVIILVSTFRFRFWVCHPYKHCLVLSKQGKFELPPFLAYPFTHPILGRIRVEMPKTLQTIIYAGDKVRVRPRLIWS